MHAAALDRFGGIDEIRMQTLPAPEIAPDEVLVRVEVAGVAVWDPFEREGGFAKMYGIKAHFPYILGSDGAGTIAEIGDQVRELKVGDRVYGAALVNPKGGFYAEYIAVKAGNVSLLPSKLTMEEAGVISSDAMTARLGLEEMLNLKKGESLMIFGASGGIGHIAVQLAKRMGARVFAVASGDDGVALVKKLGADTTVDGRKCFGLADYCKNRLTPTIARRSWIQLYAPVFLIHCSWLATIPPPLTATGGGLVIIWTRQLGRRWVRRSAPWHFCVSGSGGHNYRIPCPD